MTFFSHHALKQMLARGIDRDEAEAALREPAYSYRRPVNSDTSPEARVFVGVNGVTVVLELAHHGFEPKVLTVARKDALLEGQDNVRPIRPKNH